LDPQALAGVSSQLFQELLEFATATLHAAVLERILRVWRALREEAQQSETRIRHLSQSLQSLATEAVDLPHCFPNEHRSLGSETSQLRSVEGMLPQLVIKLDRQLAGSRLGQHLIGDELGDQARDDLKSLIRDLGVQSQTVMRQHFQETASANSPGDGPVGAERFKACADQMLPRLISNGGAKRSLFMLPANSEFDPATVRCAARLAKESATVITDGDGEAYVCFEVEQIPLVNIAVSLIRNRADYLELAERLHTRIDVDWQPIEFMAATTESPMPV
jgi:hypothetical protein